YQINALTRLVTDASRRRSLRKCVQTAPAVASSDQNLRRFAFRQHDPDLSEQRTKEAFAGES
ncbi:hypothetical protein, partial [Chromatium okenii]|uniref:hypothetical protein n=1 Tax=Chromatium okenii TaxID=61644 RepID=UPI0026E9E33C